MRSERFCVTAEVVPPRSGSVTALEEQVRSLLGYVDAVSVTDNPTASAHMSAAAGCAVVARAGLEPTVQLTVRDRNRLALISELLGAWALGARNLFCLTGDPISVGDHPEARTVADLDVLELVRLAERLGRDGAMPSGPQISEPPDLFVGVADVPLVEGYDPARLEAKLDAGAGFVVLQIVYEAEAVETWADAVRPRGVFERAGVLVSVAPLRSAAQARFVNERIPGVRVPAELVAELEAAGPDAAAEGTRHAVELVRGLRRIAGISGVHVIGLGRAERVRALIEDADLLPRPAS
ncbi:MAG TPA: methylenetetrahydrofolate reductase [Actinomycetota bacterium]|nr:methylenetetrahydrofolate reductase [Actinomycetota bacterium]